MLEALAALSLAGNIIQFADFISKAIVLFNEVRKHGATSRMEDLQATTTSLVEQTAQMKSELEQNSMGSALTVQDQVWRSLTLAWYRVLILCNSDSST
jgi:hypothetical protein